MYFMARRINALITSNAQHSSTINTHIFQALVSFFSPTILLLKYQLQKQGCNDELSLSKQKYVRAQ